MRVTVLVADDDQTVRDVVAWCLRSAGYRVLTAADGAEALRCIARTSVDLLVMDLHMPVLNGGAVLGAIKANPRSRHIPVLMLTARPQDAPPDVTVLAKPCGRGPLIETVRLLLHRGEGSPRRGGQARRSKPRTSI